MALQIVCRRTSVSYEKLSILCALLAILAISCRQRTTAALVCIMGIVLLFLDGYTENIFRQSKEKKYPFMREYLEDDVAEEISGMDEVEPDQGEEPSESQLSEDPEPVDDKIIANNMSGHRGVAVDVSPPPEPNMDDDSYALGLLVADHSTGVSYARYSRPRANPACSSNDITQEIRGRDRLRRQAPTSFTFGGYRSRTGQTSRFQENM